MAPSASAVPNKRELAWLVMGTKAERRDARARVIAYHQACLATLVEHVADAIDGYRGGERDASKVDELIHQYHPAASALSTFIWASVSEYVAALIDRPAAQNRVIDWWRRGAARERAD